MCMCFVSDGKRGSAESSALRDAPGERRRKSGDEKEVTVRGRRRQLQAKIWI